MTQRAVVCCVVCVGWPYLPYLDASPRGLRRSSGEGGQIKNSSDARCARVQRDVSATFILIMRWEVLSDTAPSAPHFTPQGRAIRYAGTPRRYVTQVSLKLFAVISHVSKQNGGSPYLLLFFIDCARLALSSLTPCLQRPRTGIIRAVVRVQVHSFTDL